MKIRLELLAHDTFVHFRSDYESLWFNKLFKCVKKIYSLSGQVPGHLYGSTDYGDNVEDEWFIVFLLMELTKTIPGLVAK